MLLPTSQWQKDLHLYHIPSHPFKISQRTCGTSEISGQSLKPTGRVHNPPKQHSGDLFLPKHWFRGKCRLVPEDLFYITYQNGLELNSWWNAALPSTTHSLVNLGSLCPNISRSTQTHNPKITLHQKCDASLNNANQRVHVQQNASSCHTDDVATSM